MKDIFLVVLLGLLAIGAILWATEDRTPTETVVLVNPIDAWWNLPKDKLEAFIRDQIARAEFVSVAVFDHHELVKAVDIRDRSDLMHLSDQFTITTEIRRPGAFLSSRVTRIEIFGTTNTRLELGRTWLMYGPSGGAKLEQSVSGDLIPGFWHTVSVSSTFYDVLRQQVAVPLY